MSVYGSAVKHITIQANVFIIICDSLQKKKRSSFILSLKNVSRVYDVQI